MMVPSSVIANCAHWAYGLPEWYALRAALCSPREAQETVLRRILRRNRLTAFGREHGFSEIESPAEYRRSVPPRSWDDLEPWVSRAAAGEPAVLTCDPIRLFHPSSGSTAPSKLVPYTRCLADEFQRGLAAWHTDMLSRRPALLGGPAYWSVSMAGEPDRWSGGGIRIGFMDDAEYLGPVARRLAAWTLVAPGAMRRVTEPAVWRRRTLLHLLRARELRLLSCWSPTFLQILLESLVRDLSSLAAEIASGSPPLAVGATRMLPGLAPDRRRASEIDRIGPKIPRLWPRLALVSCWTDGPSAGAAAELAALLPGVPMEGKGLAATEALISIPFGGLKPLAVRSHFLEFETSDGEWKWVDQLREGDVASVVVTTGGGLYRYRLHDRIQVTGFSRRTPTIQFLEKDDQFCDRFGEKLHAGFVGALIARLTGEYGCSCGLAFLAPDERDERACYTLFLAVPALPADAEARLEVLLEESFHYRHCIQLGQLAPARIFLVHPDGLEAFLDVCRRRGQRLGDVKLSPLRRESGWPADLPGQYLDDRST